MSRAHYPESLRFLFMEQIGYIYKLTAPNGKIYIGQTTSIERRYSKYARGDCKDQKKLYNSILKYGWDSFQKGIIFEGECSGKCLDRLEVLFIHQYGSFVDGLNMTKGGDKPPSWKGKKRGTQSPEHKANLSTALKGRVSPNKGKPSPIKGRHQSPEVVAWRAAKLKGKKGKPKSAEHRVKISAALKGRGSKPIQQFSKDGVWIRNWSSAKEAGEALGISKSNIAGCIRGRLKTAGGYVWKYA